MPLDAEAATTEAPAAADTSAAAITDLTGAAPGEGDASSSQSGEGDAAAAAGQGADSEGSSEGDASTQSEGAEGDEGGDAQGAPEQYADFAMPDGYELSGDMLESVTTFAKTQNLTQAQAQALVDLGAKQAQAIAEQFAGAATNTPVVAPEHWAKTWSEQTMADTELGGNNLASTVNLTSRVFKTFGTPELGEFLHTTGLAHHPELVRFMHKVGQAMSEDTLVPQPKTGDGPQPGKTPAKALYPNMK